MNRQGGKLYLLDGIEIDASRLCLKRDGKELYLRQKSFQVLIYLLTQRDRLISKNELLDHVWQDTAVTENALDQCLAEIRKVLGDDSRNPRFIKTVPRAGLRFIGEVEEVGTETDNSTPQFRSVEPIAAVIPQRTPSWMIGRRALIVVALILISGIGATAYFVIRSRMQRRSVSVVTLPEMPGKRSVAVMFFDNQSGSADIDWLREGLADMLITDLSRSQNLTILSRQQLRTLLDRAGRQPSEKISLDEALDIAQKSKATIVIMGSFARLGEQIRIDAQLNDARDGHLLVAERLIVERPEQILSQMDLLTLKLATYLSATPGDSQASLSSVMTNNLEAYRYYSLGLEKAQALQSTEAIILFEKAIALDPQFAMAHARIGYIYAVTWGNNPEKAKEYLQKAFQLSARLTEKDKLNIAAWYAIANYDYEGAIKSFRQIVSQFPLEVEAYRRLGLLLQGEERFDEAVEILKQGLITDSGAKDLYNSLGGVYLDIGRLDDAIDSYRRYVQLAPDEPNAHDSLADAYQWAGRYEEAISEYERALTLKPDFEIAIVHLGNTYFQQGRYQQAMKEYERYIHDAPSDLERMRGYNTIALVELRKGNLPAAQSAANVGLKYNPKDLEVLFTIAVAKKDMAKAAQLKEALENVNQASRGQRPSRRPVWYYRGVFDLNTGNAAEAIYDFKQALTHRAQYWILDAFEDCLANAYLELGRLDEAVAEYQRILKLNPNYPLVHYHLAQAYERKGQQDQARVEYQQFLQVWQGADADIPEVIKAKSALGA